MKKYIKIKVLHFIILVVLVFVIVLLTSRFKKINTKFSQYYSIMPAIELFNYMHINKDFGLMGGATGYVAFYDSSNSPKSIKQFYKIDSARDYEDNYKLTLKITDLVSVFGEPLSDTGTTKAYFKMNDDEKIIFEDNSGNKYIFYKTLPYMSDDNYSVAKIEMEDITGDSTYLITDRDKYRDYIWEHVLENKKITNH